MPFKVYFKICTTSSVFLVTAKAAASTSLRACWCSSFWIIIKDLDNAAAYPASNAAFHCLYLSPNLTIIISDFFIDERVLIALIFALLLSCQNFSFSFPRILTPTSSESSWLVTGPKNLIFNLSSSHF